MAARSPRRPEKCSTTHSTARQRHKFLVINSICCCHGLPNRDKYYVPYRPSVAAFRAQGADSRCHQGCKIIGSFIVRWTKVLLSICSRRGARFAPPRLEDYWRCAVLLTAGECYWPISLVAVSAKNLQALRESSARRGISTVLYWLKLRLVSCRPPVQKFRPGG